MATTKNIYVICFFFTLIALQSMIVTAQLHSCFPSYVWYEHDGFTCVGSLMRWRYSPTDDVHGDCIDWCKSFDASVGIGCAQINIYENHKIYCACYEACDPTGDYGGGR
ncbi:hypothetical protein MKX03_020928 [Papaver bracteatum]|nr:hypothetical protein MKX03_020928 [Papaver bracteatum]